jgi:hypothetical protein
MSYEALVGRSTLTRKSPLITCTPSNQVAKPADDAPAAPVAPVAPAAPAAPAVPGEWPGSLQFGGDYWVEVGSILPAFRSCRETLTKAGPIR